MRAPLGRLTPVFLTRRRVVDYARHATCLCR